MWCVDGSAAVPGLAEASRAPHVAVGLGGPWHRLLPRRGGQASATSFPQSGEIYGFTLHLLCGSHVLCDWLYLCSGLMAGDPYLNDGADADMVTCCAMVMMLIWSHVVQAGVGRARR
jgi:hypothetical protein